MIGSLPSFFSDVQLYIGSYQTNLELEIEQKEFVKISSRCLSATSLLVLDHCLELFSSA